METVSKILFIIALVAIEYLATTTIAIKPLEHSWDKANHFIAFFVLFSLLTYAHSYLSNYMKFYIIILFGIQIEIVQFFIPNRDFSLLDIFADSIGIFIAMLFLYFVKKSNFFH